MIKLLGAIGLVAITATAAWGQTGDRVRDVAGNAGRVIGQALVCGVDQETLVRVGESALNVINSLAPSQEARRYAVDLYIHATAAGANKQKDRRTAEPCSQVREGLAEMGRMLGKFLAGQR